MAPSPFSGQTSHVGQASHGAQSPFGAQAPQGHGAPGAQSLFGAQASQVGHGFQGAQSPFGAQASHVGQDSNGAQSPFGVQASQGAQSLPGVQASQVGQAFPGAQSQFSAQASQGAQSPLGAQSSHGAQSPLGAQASQGLLLTPRTPRHMLQGPGVWRASDGSPMFSQADIPPGQPDHDPETAALLENFIDQDNHKKILAHLGVGERSAKLSELETSLEAGSVPYKEYWTALAKCKAAQQWKSKFVSLGAGSDAVQGLNIMQLGNYLLQHFNQKCHIVPNELQEACPNMS